MSIMVVGGDTFLELLYVTFSAMSGGETSFYLVVDIGRGYFRAKWRSVYRFWGHLGRPRQENKVLFLSQIIIQS